MNKQQLLSLLKQEQHDEKIIKAFSKIKRENFIDKQYKQYAYENQPIPLAPGATISQPSTIAFMLDILELKDNQQILELGSGCGYVLAIINEISKKSKIYGIERIKQLVESSQQILKTHKNITIFHVNDKQKLKNQKFDRILISASADKPPKNLIKQLKPDGILITPIKNSIYKFKKTKNKIQSREFPGFVFVPLIED